MRHIVVIGGSVAGVHAVQALRQVGFDGRVSLVDTQEHLPYDRPPLSKAALRPDFVTDDVLLKPASWYDEQDIGLLLGQTATNVDFRARRISLRDGTELAFDGLVLATGSVARRLHPSIDSTRVLSLRTWDDCMRLRHRLVPGSHLVVIGGGFIGLELAATGRELGLEVSVVEVASAPLAPVLGDEVGQWFTRLHQANGVTVYCRNAVSRIDAVGTGNQVELEDGTVLSADVVVAGVGASPAVEWLADSGLELSNGVRCDAFLRTSVPGVVAAGDIACWYNPLYGDFGRVEHWSNAVEQGSYAAKSLLDMADEPYVGPPYFWSDQFNARVRFIGRSADAQIRIQDVGDQALVAEYARNGLLDGAVCVNAPRKLIAYRQELMRRTMGPLVHMSP